MPTILKACAQLLLRGQGLSFFARSTGPLRRGSSTLLEPSHSQHIRRKPQISCVLSPPGLERDLWNTLNHSVRTHSRYFWTYEETFIEQFSTMYCINEKVTKRKFCFLWDVTMICYYPYNGCIFWSPSALRRIVFSCSWSMLYCRWPWIYP